jgi:hypothetical protein
MFYKAGFGSGSTKAELWKDDPQQGKEVSVCIYPRIMHVVKGTYKGAVHTPRLQMTFTKQKLYLKRMFKDLTNMDMAELTGYRIEFWVNLQFRNV